MGLWQALEQLSNQSESAKKSAPPFEGGAHFLALLVLTDPSANRDYGDESSSESAMMMPTIAAAPST